MRKYSKNLGLKNNFTIMDRSDCEDIINLVIDNIKLTPLNSKYKVYIIDEVHMLTKEAFNALLLTLEEPPSHAVFILATTNIESVPITVLSRCQRMEFHKISTYDIMYNLRNICIKEKINIVNDSDYQKAIIVLGAILTADINGANSDEYMMFENTKEIRIIPGGNIFLTIALPSGSELQVKLKDVVNINDDMAILRRAIIMDTFEGLPNGSFDMTGEEYIYRKYD